MNLVSTRKRLRASGGRLIREFEARVESMRQPRHFARAVFFASQRDSGGSGHLRAHAVGRALRLHGWRTVIPHPSLTLKQRLRIIAAERPDVILLQQARHPLNRPSYYRGIPCVFDLDDADILDPGCSSQVIEAASESRAVVAGSRFVADLLRPYNSDVTIIWTCLDREIAHALPPQVERKAVVAWASANPSGFPREAQLIQRAMIELARRVPFTFRLYGAHDRWGVRNPEFARNFIAPIQDAGATIETVSMLEYPQFLRSLESVAVGLQAISIEHDHSKGRSFGKILAYLASGVAVVASNAVDHPLFFRDSINGMLVGDDSSEWVRACERLLLDADLRTRIACQGRADLNRRLTVATAAKLLDPVLRRAVQKRPVSPGANE